MAKELSLQHYYLCSDLYGYEFFSRSMHAYICVPERLSLVFILKHFHVKVEMSHLYLRKFALDYHIAFKI